MPRPLDREPRAGAITGNRSRTHVLPLALPEPNQRWLVLLGPRSVDQLQGLLCLIAKVEPQDHGPGPPIPGPRVSVLGPLVLAL